MGFWFNFWSSFYLKDFLDGGGIVWFSTKTLSGTKQSDFVKNVFKVREKYTLCTLYIHILNYFSMVCKTHSWFQRQIYSVCVRNENMLILKRPVKINALLKNKDSLAVTKCNPSKWLKIITNNSSKYNLVENIKKKHLKYSYQVKGDFLS